METPVVNKLNVASLGLTLAALCAIPSASEAQDSSGRGDGFRLHAGLGLGVGGEIETDVDTAVGNFGGEGDLNVTPALHLGIEVPLHTYFTLGGELGFAFWQIEDSDNDRQLNLDILARPKLRIPLADGFEVYAVVPVGYTHYIPRDVPDELEGGPGFAVGGMAGASYFFTDAIGVTGELGYMYRKFNSTIDAGIAGDQDVDSKFGQFQINLGAALAF